MDSSDAFLKIMSFCFTLLIIFIILHLSRGSIGKFLDKISSFTYLREGGNYKYKDANKELTYEGNVLLSSFDVFFLLIGVYISLGIDFYFSYLISIIAIPYFLILLRIRTFSDSSILPETEMGYNPLKTYKLTLVGSVGLILLLTMFWFNKFPFYVYIIGLVYGLVPFLIPILPDYVGKFLDYEIRSEKGQKLLWLIEFLLFTILIFIILLIYEFIITTTNVNTLMYIIVAFLAIIGLTWKLKKDYNLFSVTALEK